MACPRARPTRRTFVWADALVESAQLGETLRSAGAALADYPNTTGSRIADAMSAIALTKSERVGTSRAT